MCHNHNHSHFHFPVINTQYRPAFPLDTLKTKSQVLAQKQKDTSIQANTDGSLMFESSDVSNLNMFQLIVYVYRQEG